jgi:hypothetical protein
MPRPRPIVKADVQKRKAESQIDPALVDRLCQKAPVPGDRREKFAREVCGELGVYRARTIAHRQERPAKKVATLKKGLTAARKLQAWLNSQADSIRMELQTGGLEHFLEGLELLLQELAANAKSRSSYWKTHTMQNRPFGEGQISLWLRQGLTDIANRYLVTSTEREKRNWVVSVLKEVGVRYPNEKKNKKRFVG